MPGKPELAQVFDGLDPLSWRDLPVADRNLFGSQAYLSGSYGAGHKYFDGVPLPPWLDRGPDWQSFVLLYPNLGIWLTSDQLALDFVLPVGPDHHLARQEFYFHASVEGESKYQPAIDALFQAWDGVFLQDAKLLEGLHDNQLSNSAAEHRSRFAGNWEINVHAFQKYYLESLRRANTR